MLKQTLNFECKFKSLMKNFCFTLILILSLVSLSAQSISLSGRVLDKATQKPLVNASILLKPGNVGTVTSKDGTFTFESLSKGEYRLEVKYLGYTTVHKAFALDGRQAPKLTIEMEVDVRQLLAVEIKDDKIDNTPYRKITLKKADIEQSAVRDIGDYLRQVPNVQAVRKGGANLDPVVRGFKFDQLNITVDQGLSIEGGCPNRMDPTTSHVEAEDIEAIEILKGPHALRYGPSFGGVINLITINPRPFEKFQIHTKGILGYESNWGGQRQHLTVLGGGQKVFFALTGNNSQYGNYRDGNGDQVKSHFQKFGYTAKLGFQPFKNHIIYASYSEFYARNVFFPALPMDERTDNTKLYALDYRAKKVSDLIETIDFKGYYTHVDHTMDNKERSYGDTVAAVSQIIADRMGYRAEVGLNVAGGHLFVGTDYMNINKDGDRTKNIIGQGKPVTGMGGFPIRIEKLWNEAVITNYGVWGEFKKPWKKIELIAAVRLDFNSASSDSIFLNNMENTAVLLNTLSDSTNSVQTNLSFSVGGTYMITKNLSTSLAFGRGVRSPNMLERFIILLPVGYDNFEYMGNPTLKPETNNEADFSIKYKKGNLGALEATVFYSMIQDYISGEYLPPSVQKPLTSGAQGVKIFQNMGDATMMGFEFGYTSPDIYKWKFDLTAAYTQGTLAKGDHYAFDANGDPIVTEITNDPLSEIPPLELNANLSYKLFDAKIIPAIHFRYVAAQERVSEIALEPTSPSFNLFDARITYKHNQNLSVVGGVNNLMNTAYTEHLNRRVFGTDYRIYEPGRVFYVNLIFNI